MITRRLIPVSLFLFVCFCTCFPVFGQGKIIDVKFGKEEGPVEVEADELSYERTEQTYHGHGHVEVTRGAFNLRADHARMNTATNELTAWGNVFMSEGEDALECERLEVNLETRQGKIYKARLFLKNNNYHILGEEAEKLGENRYRVRDGSITTCDDRRPPWKFTVKELDVTLDGRGIARGPVFYLEDIPVLYLPVAVIPLRKERQTGFVLPQIKPSGEDGPEVGVGFYWAMTKEMDATFSLNYIRDRGFKEGLEYRYALGRESGGEARIYFIDDKLFDGRRYAAFFQGEQKLPEDFYLKANINHVSDRIYLRDFDEDLPVGSKMDSTSTRHLRSVLFGGKNWDQFSFLAQGMVFEDLTVPVGVDLSRLSDDVTVQKLPEVSFSAHPQSLYKNIFFYDLTSSYTNFSREEGVEAHRFELFPRFSYPTRLFNVLKLDSNLGFRETYYRSFNDPQGRAKGSKSREIFEADVAMSTEFYKVHDGTSLRWLSDLFNVTRWLHTVEPTIRYRYIPRVNQDDLPRLDDLDRPVFDRIPDANEITYGFTQRLVGKPQKEKVDSGPFEYASLSIAQAYSFGDPFVMGGRKREFSSVQAELALRFSPYLLVRSDAGFDPYRGGLDAFNSLVRVKDKRNDTFQVDYRFSKTPPLIDTTDSTNLLKKINTINFHTKLKTIESLYVYGGLRYNLEDQSKVENIYGLEYQAQCWTVGVFFEDRRVATIEGKNQSPVLKRDTSWQVYINLLGLGTLGHRPKFLGL
ncbi:MAG: LPS-assembly protein LptD [Deltaproteobacteria bacterium]|nr:MAG: LPS-assembly protein LptD [Deltaproteobacteria bacterium]